MMKNIINRLPIDTEVYQPNYGKGKVIDVFIDGYSIYFQNLDDNITFGLNGENIDEYPISLTKYDIINGGFTSILDYDKSADDEVKTLIIYNDIESDIQYLIVPGDYSRFNGIIFNSINEHEFTDECMRFIYNDETGERNHLGQWTEDKSLLENKQWDKVAIVTWIP